MKIEIAVAQWIVLLRRKARGIKPGQASKRNMKKNIS